MYVFRFLSYIYLHTYLYIYIYVYIFLFYICVYKDIDICTLYISICIYMYSYIYMYMHTGSRLCEVEGGCHALDNPRHVDLSCHNLTSPADFLLSRARCFRHTHESRVPLGHEGTSVFREHQYGNGDLTCPCYCSYTD